MKRKSINALYSFVMLLFITLFAQAQQEHKVAVFEPVGSVEKALLEIVREEISSVVVNTKGYTVLERQLINKVLEENRFQESGLVNDEQVSDIGKRMGADYVFVTAISKLGENYYISCKMIEVSTAHIDKQSTGTTTNGINDIPQTTQYIVRRLFGENVQQQVTARQNSKTDEQVMLSPSKREPEGINNEPVLSNHPFSKRKGYVGVSLGIGNICDDWRLQMGANVGYLLYKNIGLSFIYQYVDNNGFFNSLKYHSFFLGPFYSLPLNKENTLYMDLSPLIGPVLLKSDYWSESHFSLGVNTSLKWHFKPDFSLSLNIDGRSYHGFVFSLYFGAHYHF